MNKSSTIVYSADKLSQNRYLAIVLFNLNELQTVWKLNYGSVYDRNAGTIRLKKNNYRA